MNTTNKKPQLTEERKIHIREVFNKDADVIVKEFTAKLDWLEHKYQCSTREKMLKVILKKLNKVK